jgi:hypothetical protein
MAGASVVILLVVLVVSVLVIDKVIIGESVPSPINTQAP